MKNRLTAALMATAALVALGTDMILFAEQGGKEVQGKKLDPRTVLSGETLDFTLDLARLHVFAAASARSLRA